MEQKSMSYINVKFKVLESVKDLSDKVSQIIESKISTIFNRVGPISEKELGNLLKNSLKSQPEYTSLKSGELRYNFGIANVSVVDTLIERLARSITMKIATNKIAGNKIDASIIFSFFSEGELESILGSDEANVFTAKGQVLPWLKWLLLEGNEPLVLTHRIYIEPRKASRTGLAIMVPSKNGSWRVPPAYVGTESNNWVTRAISSAFDGNSVKQILSKTFKKGI